MRYNKGEKKDAVRKKKSIRAASGNHVTASQLAPPVLRYISQLPSYTILFRKQKKKKNVNIYFFFFFLLLLPTIDSHARRQFPPTLHQLFLGCRCWNLYTRLFVRSRGERIHITWPRTGQTPREARNAWGTGRKAATNKERRWHFRRGTEDEI